LNNTKGKETMLTLENTGIDVRQISSFAIPLEWNMNLFVFPATQTQSSSFLDDMMIFGDGTGIQVTRQEKTEDTTEE
jgi:hypothetical protein